MKKIFVLFLVIVLMASLSVTASATGNTITYDNSRSAQSSGVKVTYNVQPTFTVKIPQTVTMGGDVEVSTSDVVVEYGKAVKVILDGTNEKDNAFVLRTPEGASITYKIMKGKTPLAVGDTVLTATPTETDPSVILTFVAPDSITYAGNYTGTVTFSIVVANITGETT